MQATDTGFVKHLPRMALCAAGGLALTLAVMYLSAVLTASGAAGAGQATAMVAGSCSAGTLAAGFFAARPIMRQILPIGLTTGGFYVVLLLVIGALFFPGTLPTGGVAPVCAAALAGACLGALCASILPRRR
ncbi:MAG: hypothetical protein E7463_04025 [Ruminococcaceae bacterium]|nr:hypothetical protein [Oscillospiraceae bacterium]